jgi:hypothetical protein
MQTGQTLSSFPAARTSGSSRGDVNAMRVVASALGVGVGVSGLDHGLFEIMRGNTPTSTLIVKAIGPEQQMWLHGTEEAFTIVPNFLATGILAVAVALAIIVWSVGFIDRPNGSRTLLGLGALLFAVGGGIGMVIFLALGWAISRRIHRPLSVGVHPRLSKLWPAFLVAGLVLYAAALEIAIWGVVPGVADPEIALLICWSCLAGMMAAMLAAAVAGSAHDLERLVGRAPADAPV